MKRSQRSKQRPSKKQRSETSGLAESAQAESAQQKRPKLRKELARNGTAPRQRRNHEDRTDDVQGYRPQ
jgi:hypothetical protein